MVASSSINIPSDTLILPVSVVTVAVVSIALTLLSVGNSLDKKAIVNLTFILPFLKMENICHLVIDRCVMAQHSHLTYLHIVDFAWLL